MTSYPNVKILKEEIIKILAENFGVVRIQNVNNETIYTVLADRFDLSDNLRKRITPGGENYWRQYVGWAKKSLAMEGMIIGHIVVERGVWALSGSQIKIHNIDEAMYRSQLMMLLDSN